MSNRVYYHLNSESILNKPMARDISDDFYGYVNGTWLSKVEIPASESRLMQAYYIREQIDTELNEIIRREKREGKGPIAELLQSWDNQSQSGSAIPSGIHTIFQMIYTITTPVHVCGMLGWLIRHGINNPLSLYVEGDPRNRSRCRIFIEEGDLNIGIPEYWLDPDQKEKREAYEEYCQTLAKHTGMPGIMFGYGAEREFAKKIPTRDRAKYDMLKWSELREKYKSIDWSVLLQNWSGESEDTYGDVMFHITSYSYIQFLQHSILTWSMPRWRGYFTMLVTQWIAGLSPHGPLRSAWFNYTQRFLQGKRKDLTPVELRMTAIRSLLPHTLGELWVSQQCTKDLQTNMHTMIQVIRDTAIKSLRNTEWMSPSTREAAIEKLRHMDIQVCWPSKWRHDLEKHLSPVDLVENLRLLARRRSDDNYHHIRDTTKKGCSGRNDEWGRPVYEVNAFYYPGENRFVLPAGILRAPFYDPKKSLAWNYGGIGATIGHELCHAFDSEGRLYDKDGDLHDWWTDRDTKEYKKRAAAVVRMFNDIPYRGMDVDGEMTLTENIADFGGAEFALAGLKMAMGRALTMAELREFFMSFAVGWRAKDRLRRAAQLLDMDPHAPPKLRVNNTVRQMDDWYEAFGITEGDPGYISPEKRIHFFR